RPAFINRRFVMTKAERWTQLETWAFFAAQNSIDHVDGILAVQQEHAFLEDEFAHVIDPDRQPILETELVQIVGRAEIELTAGAFLPAERNGLVVIETEVLGDLTPHHHTTMWRGQGGDKEAVISASDRTRDGTGCETAK